jgi:hypothetical protein
MELPGRESRTTKLSSAKTSSQTRRVLQGEDEAWQQFGPGTGELTIEESLSRPHSGGSLTQRRLITANNFEHSAHRIPLKTLSFERLAQR